MKIQKSTIYFVIGFILLLLLGYAAYYTFSGSQYISAKKAKQMIKSKEIVHVIDVRTQAEWNLGHYKNAIHFPSANINQESIKKVLPKMNVKKTDGILTYCNSGQRARAAAEKLEKAGYKNTYYIAGNHLTIQ